MNTLSRAVHLYCEMCHSALTPDEKPVILDNRIYCQTCKGDARKHRAEITSKREMEDAVRSWSKFFG